MPGRPGPSITAHGDGSISVNYSPKERGTHEMTVNYNEQPVEGRDFMSTI